MFQPRDRGRRERAQLGACAPRRPFPLGIQRARLVPPRALAPPRVGARVRSNRPPRGRALAPPRAAASSQPVGSRLDRARGTTIRDGARFARRPPPTFRDARSRATAAPRDSPPSTVYAKNLRPDSAPIRAPSPIFVTKKNALTKTRAWLHRTRRLTRTLLLSLTNAGPRHRKDSGLSERWRARRDGRNAFGADQNPES